VVAKLSGTNGGLKEAFAVLSYVRQDICSGQSSLRIRFYQRGGSQALPSEISMH
jgi:hypothetical protein